MSVITSMDYLFLFVYAVPFALYPRDAVLASVLGMTLCPFVCVCLSVTSRCSIEIGGRNELDSDV